MVHWGNIQVKCIIDAGYPGLRKVMLRAHKQAWCWQDEWHGLTILDIRRLEKETQLALQLKFGSVGTEESDNEEDYENKVGFAS